MYKNGNVTLMVADMDRAVEFYSEKLSTGFRKFVALSASSEARRLNAGHGACNFRNPVLSLELKVRYGNEWAEVTAPGITLGLHQARGPISQSDPNIGISIGLEVDDIEAAVREVTDKGIAFPSSIRETNDLREASFTDPDGTSLYLTEIKPQYR